MKPESYTPKEDMLYFFKEEFINECNAFTKYYEAIKKNGYIFKIIHEIENMGNYCDLFKDVCKNYVHESLNLYCDHPIPKNEENENILYSTRHIKMVNSPTKGRCLVADCKIRQNTVIIQELPTILQVNPLCSCVGDNQASLYRCHHCGSACNIFFTCEGCNVCIFCSRTCLHNSYVLYHKYECYGVQRHFWSMNDTDYSYISLRMMLYGASRKFETQPVGSNFGDETNNYPYIYQMESHFNKLPWPKINEILYSSVKNLIYLILKTKFFDQYKEENYVLNDLQQYVGGLLVKHYCQAEANSVLLKFYNVAAGFGINVISGSGKAICPTIGLLNHSCSPNAVIVIYYGYIAVKTLKPIKTGEEITICYKEVDLLLSCSERQLITEELFHFTCDCDFCNFEKDWWEAPYKCELCVNGRAKSVKMEDGTVMTHCLLCQHSFTSNYIAENIERARVCKKLYSATHSIDKIIRTAGCYANIFPPNSWHLMDVYKFLYERFAFSQEKPFEAIKYGLLCFDVFEQHISRLNVSLLIAKIKFIIRMLNMTKLSEVTVVSEDEYEVLKTFRAEVTNIKEDLLFHLPNERIFFHRDLLIKVHQLFQALTIY